MGAMNDDKDLMTLKTQVAAPQGAGRDAAPSKDKGLPLLGLFAVGFALLGIFSYGPVFVPLGLVLGIAALFVGQVGLGILAVVLSVIGVLSSPSLLIMLGLGALGAWFGFGA